MEKKYSIQTGVKNSFTSLDYLVFGGTLLISATIGIYYAIRDRKIKTVKQFLLAGGKMPVFPVALSLLATFMSAITLLGNPAEIYMYNTMFLWIGVGYIFAMFGTAHIYLPIFYNLKITSCYEYLEMRFNKVVRTITTVLYIIQMIIYMGIVLYAPSLAINAVTGLNLWGAIFAVGLVCIFYTTLGGMKAVLWTDVFQIVVMIAGLLAALVQGSIEIGGFSKAWQIAADNGRVVYDDFSVDPRTRHSVWSLVIGGGILWTSIYGTNQAQFQRAASCKSLLGAKIALWLNAPGLIFILILTSLIGSVMYAFYSICDPLKYGLVTASDQLFPLFVMDILGHIPGMPGLFIACIFSGSLSSISSGLNALVAVLLQDILKPFCLKDMKEPRATLLSKIMAFVFGLICLGFTWVASQMGGVLQAALSLFGIIGAPIMGLFTLGMLFPWANSVGALFGLLTSIIMMLWIGIGSFLAKLPRQISPVSVHGCMNNTLGLLHDPSLPTLNNISVYHNTTIDSIALDTSESSILTSIYSVSYLWYSLIAIVVVIVVGLPISFITGAQKPSELDARLICPIFDILLPCLPKRIRRKLYFGVQHNQITQKRFRNGIKEDVPGNTDLDNTIPLNTPHNT